MENYEKLEEKLEEKNIQITPEICRYCLDEEKLIYPCSCTTPVHKSCLITWLKSQSEKPFFSGYKCEICTDAYNVVTEKKTYIRKVFWLKLLQAYFNLSVFLFLVYILIGSMIQISSLSSYELFQKYGTPGEFTNMIWCGFVGTHLFLGVLYVFYGLISMIRGQWCLFVFMGDCRNCDSQEACTVSIFFLILLSILALILTLYMETYVYIRKKNEYERTIIKDVICRRNC